MIDLFLLVIIFDIVITFLLQSFFTMSQELVDFFSLPILLIVFLYLFSKKKEFKAIFTTNKILLRVISLLVVLSIMVLLGVSPFNYIWNNYWFKINQS